MKPKFVFAASIDLTSVCNLDCRHCYLEKRSDRDLSDSQWIERIESLKREHPLLLHAVWFGGEPLLRRKLLVELLSRFRYNSVFSNGLLPFSGLPENCAVQISIDGTEKIHDFIRGEWTFRKTIANMLSAPENRYAVSFTINRFNADCIEETVEFFARPDAPKILGIHFNFHTCRDVSDIFGIEDVKRQEILDLMEKLHAKHRDLLFITPTMIRDLRPTPRIYTKNCPFNTGFMVSIDSMGNRKTPCWYGESRCEDCGCCLAYEYSPKNLFHPQAAWKLARLFVNSR